VRLILTGTTLGHRWAAIQWLQLTQTSRTSTDLQSIVSSISAAWGTRFAPDILTTTQLNEVLGVWIVPGPGEIIATDSTVRAGTVTSTTQVQDASACLILQWHISAYYRGGHPRTYLPGLGVSAITNGSDLSSGTQSAFQASALAYMNDINALTHGGITGVTFGTVSFQTAHAWRTPPIFRPFIGVGVNPKLGTQRRRIHS
jgi:hypothetical protein